MNIIDMTKYFMNVKKGAKLISARTQDNITYYLPATGFGEIKAICSIIPLLREKHADHEFRILIQETRTEILDLLPEDRDVIEVISVSEYKAYIFSIFNEFGFKKYQERMEQGFVFTSIDPYIKSVLLDRITNLKLLQVTKDIVQVNGDKYLSFKLPKKIEQYEYLIDKYNLVKGKTVFFNTNARTVKGITNDLFEMIAQQFQRRGYRIATFVKNKDEKTVNGSIGIIETLENSAALLELGGYLIGVRSGFMDVMSDFDCKICAIYSSDFMRKDFFSLFQWKGNADCIEIIDADLCLNSRYEKIVDDILN